MPRPVHRLTDQLVASLEEPRLHADGAGLYLRIDSDGSRRWSFIYHSPRRREMSLGVLRTVGLTEARHRADLARSAIRAGLDPIAERDAAIEGVLSTMRRDRPAVVRFAPPAPTPT